MRTKIKFFLNILVRKVVDEPEILIKIFNFHIWKRTPSIKSRGIYIPKYFSNIFAYLENAQ